MQPHVSIHHLVFGALIALALTCGAKPAQPVVRFVVVTDARPDLQ